MPTLSARARLLAAVCLLGLVSVVVDLRPAQASPATEAACAHEGALAERLALARDKGVTMNEAIDTVLTAGRNATREQLTAMAALLFQRFRYMPADKVAFEFMLACMDDAE